MTSEGRLPDGLTSISDKKGAYFAAVNQMYDTITSEYNDLLARMFGDSVIGEMPAEYKTQLNVIRGSYLALQNSSIDIIIESYENTIKRTALELAKLKKKKKKVTS